MSLTPGSTIGQYEVLGILGEGGMGAVYRARDTKLNRQVALKVLPDLFATDPDRVARFTREAQVLASLNHPNVAAIYGIEQGALIMELVDGQDLSAIIATGPLPMTDALPIARQIADALEAAHEQGVIHRDLKPANIKVRPDGTVKVLDFGLAKALSSDNAGAPDLQNSPTLTARATQMGTILGTAAYMSPEQARGKAVDRRADIWAFGVVLYEMLTGRRAFEGDDVSITIANVLKDDPRWHDLPTNLPPPLTRLLRRCLEKDPRKRLSSIGDARLELNEDESSSPRAATAAVAVPPARSIRSIAFPLAAGILVTAAVAAAMWPRSVNAPRSGVTRLSMLPPSGERLYPDSMGVAVSPDGFTVAYVVGSIGRAESQLWLRSLDSMKARKLEGAAGVNLPFWSPDGKRLGFMSDGKLKILPITGGRPETLADAPSFRGASWGAGNVIVFAPNAGGPLLKVAASGGKAEPATSLDATRKEEGHRMPWFLPDGEHFLYVSLPAHDGKFDAFVGSVSDTSRVSIGSFDAAPVYADPGYLLYARQGTLVAVPFDVRAMKITGEAISLEDEPSSILDPTISWTAGHSVYVSKSGALAYYSAPSINTTATWYDANGVATGPLNLPPGHYESIEVSPDGTRGVAVKSVSPSESSLWLVDLARGNASPFSTGAGRNDAPVWSPDGKRVIWVSDRSGPENFYIKNIDDAQPERLFFESQVMFNGATSWSPDGHWVITNQLDPDTAQNVYAMDASGSKPPVLLVRSRFRDMGGTVSPDGKWLAFTSEESGQFELYAQAFPTPGPHIHLSSEGGITGWWTNDGRQFVYVGADERSLWRVDVQSGATLTVGTPHKFATLPADVVRIAALPDRKRFIGIAAERVGTGSITIVQNWLAAIR